MTVRSVSNIAAIWLFNGGAREHMVVATAVAEAESGGNDAAISPSQDYGLWQINLVNFRQLGLNTQTALDPNRSARAAIIMSGNGTNWAAWCTCWQNPARDCGHGFLPIPQPNTPAGERLANVASILHSVPPHVNGTAAQPGLHQAGLGWQAVQHFMGPYARARYASYANARTAIRRIR